MSALELLSEHLDVSLVDNLAVQHILGPLLLHDLDVVRIDSHPDLGTRLVGVVVLDLELVAGIGIDIHLIMHSLEGAGLDSACELR